MKIIYIVIVTLLLNCIVTHAQDFSGPQYAKWGKTSEDRKENILNASLLKEYVENGDYNAAIECFISLVEKCPTALESIYAQGIKLYCRLIEQTDGADRLTYVNALMGVYDLRNIYFGDHPTRGKDYILGMKARALLHYNPSDSDGIRTALKEAIDAAIAKNGTADPVLVSFYTKYYQNSD